jgi:hypothetical protein
MRQFSLRLLLLLSALVAGAPAWASDFAVRFDEAFYLQLPLGTSAGLSHATADGKSVATSGELRDANGATVGLLTVVSADELDAIARVDELSDARGLEPVTSVAFPTLGLEFVAFQDLDHERFFVFEASGADRRGLHPGSKGELLTADGRVGPCFRSWRWAQSPVSAASASTRRVCSIATWRVDDS